MRKKWKKALAAVCIVSMLMTMLDLGVLADEMQEEELIVADAEVPEETVESLAEDDIDCIEARIEENNVNKNTVEEIVGADWAVLGGDVEGAFYEETGAVKLISHSDGEPVDYWIDLLNCPNREAVKSIEVVLGTVYLPDKSDYMFKELVNLTDIDLSGFNTSRVLRMVGLFRACSSLTSIDLSSFDTSKVLDMHEMFYDCTSLQSLDLSSFDTSNVGDGMGDMAHMFGNCSSLTSIDLSSFDTSKVEDMRYMFEGCSRLTSLDLSSFDVSNTTEMGSMFYRCYNLQLICTPKNNSQPVDLPIRMYDSSGKAYTHLPNTTESIVLAKTQQMAQEYERLKVISLAVDEDVIGPGDIELGGGVTATFDEKTGAVGLYSDNGYLVNDWFSTDRKSVKSIKVIIGTVFLDFEACSVFEGLDNLTDLDLSDFDTSRTVGMASLFRGCKSLKSIDLCSFDTSNVLDMSEMFYDCTSLQSLDLSSFDTSNVGDGMGDMAHMFGNCSSLTSIDLSSFDTSKVEDMRYMFEGCSRLTSLDLSSFDVSNATEMGGMFYDCYNLQLICTPKNNSQPVVLPIKMYDSAGNSYTHLPNTTESIVLAKTQQMAQEYEGQKDKNYFSIVRGEHNSYNHTSGDFYTTMERQLYQTSYSTNLSNYINTKTEENRLLDALNKPWDGSCFGASASMVLKNLGIEEISSTSTYYDLGKPRDNIKLRDVINYYQVCQNLNEYSTDYRTVRGGISGLTIALTKVVSLKNFLKNFVAEAQKSQEERKPFLFNYCYKEEGEKATEGHCVIVCGIERSDYDNDSISEYKVKIYDLNYGSDPPEYIYMYIEEDFSSFHFQDMNHKSVSEYIRSLIDRGAMEDNVDWSQYNLENIWTNLSYVGIDKLENDSFYKINRNKNLAGVSEYETLVGSSDNGDKDDQYATVIIDADKQFVLQNDQGKKLIFNGKYSGDLEIYEFDYIIDETPKLKLHVLPSDIFIISDVTEDFSIAADIDGKYYRASTSGANEITLNKDGIEIDGDDDYSFSVVVGTEIKDYELIQVSSSTNGKTSVVNEGEMVSVTSEIPIQSIVVNAISENENNEVEYSGNEKSVYIGEDDGVIHIGDVDIVECAITLSSTNYTYDGKAKKPAITVKHGTIELSQGADYSVTYSNNTSAGTATVTVTGTGNYKGEKSVTFTINKASAKLAFIEGALTKKTTDTAFTNALTKTTDGTVTFKSSDTNVATVNSMSGHVTIKGAGTATITATASEGKNYKEGSAAYLLVVEAPKPTVSGFSDVQDPNHAYYKAIYWAANAGITKGYSDGTFGINRSCTRGEMMMFLWRYAGKPAPKTVLKSPFKDVPKTHTFYKAILWGSQKGITKGYSDGTFGINRNVSRGECMMFLWRLKGKPAPKAVAKAPFPDVPKSHVFYNAVLWGYQKKITTGFTSGKLKGKFGVNENCSRGQIVTFLYRAK